jgi:hypothetical protein
MKFPPYPKYKPSGAEWLGDVPALGGEGVIVVTLRRSAVFCLLTPASKLTMVFPTIPPTPLIRTAHQGGYSFPGIAILANSRRGHP